MNRIEVSKELQNAIREFKILCSRQPSPSEIEVHQGKDYIPISHIEAKLGEVFLEWETCNFTTSVIGNELIGSITLRVLHPILCIWIERIGAAGQIIQLVKDSPILDASKKIANALEKNYPSLKSKCISNAAASWGIYFGSNLNRTKTDEFDPFESMKFEGADKAEIIEATKNTLKLVDSGALLLSYHERLPIHLRKDADIVQVFTDRKNELIPLLKLPEPKI
jgi:hypothetical protein